MGSGKSKTFASTVQELEQNYDFSKKGSRKSYPIFGVLSNTEPSDKFFKVLKGLGLNWKKTKRQGSYQGTTYEINKGNKLKLFFKIIIVIIFLILLVLYIKNKYF